MDTDFNHKKHEMHEGGARHPQSRNAGRTLQSIRRVQAENFALTHHRGCGIFFNA